MRWKKHFQVPDGSHAFLSGSKYSWINYDEQKLIEAYLNYRAKQRGTLLHKFADDCIKLKVMLPDNGETLNMYVNDAIRMNMRSEQLLYFSKNAFGTADSIGFENNFLRIHDLKTGKTPASFHQLEVYSAYFCLEYDIAPMHLNGIELRIYQNNSVQIENPGVDVVIPIMDKIITFDRIIFEMGED